MAQNKQPDNISKYKLSQYHINRLTNNKTPKSSKHPPSKSKSSLELTRSTIPCPNTNTTSCSNTNTTSCTNTNTNTNNSYDTNTNTNNSYDNENAKEYRENDREINALLEILKFKINTRGKNKCVFHVFIYSEYSMEAVNNIYMFNPINVFKRFEDDGHIIKVHSYIADNTIDNEIKRIQLTLDIEDNTMDNEGYTQTHIYIMVDPLIDSVHNLDPLFLKKYDNRLYVYNTQPISWYWAADRALAYIRNGLTLMDSSQYNLKQLIAILRNPVFNMTYDATKLIYLPVQMSSHIMHLNKQLQLIPKQYDIGIITANISVNKFNTIPIRVKDMCNALSYLMVLLTPPGNHIPRVHIIPLDICEESRNIEIAKCKVVIYVHPNKYWDKEYDTHVCDPLILAGYPIIIESTLSDTENELNNYYGKLQVIRLPTLDYNIMENKPFYFYTNNYPNIANINSIRLTKVDSINPTHLIYFLNKINSALNPLCSRKKYMLSHLPKCVQISAIKARVANYKEFINRMPL